MSESPGSRVFRTERLIRFALGDQAGVLFFAHIFPLAHGVTEDFVTHCGLAWDQWFASTEYGIPFRHVEAEYLCPLRPGDRVVAELRVARLGTTAVTFAVDFTREGRLAARVSLTCVFTERPTFRPIPLPALIREKLTPYAG